MKKRVWISFAAALIVFFCGGCEAFQEAIEAGSHSDNPNSDDYQMHFVVGIFSIVEYPRASMLEREIRSADGDVVVINTNQNFSSKNIRDARWIARPGNPDVCDLQFRLDRLGKSLWQMLAGRHHGEQVVLVVDERYVARFVPEFLEDESSDWVTLRVGIDVYTAKGIAKWAKKNYAHLNPNTTSWFDNL